MSKHDYNTARLTDFESEEAQYFAGFLATDGHIITTTTSKQGKVRTNHTVCLKLIDEHILKTFASYASPTTHVHTINPRRANEATLYKVNVHCKEYTYKLISVGITPNKTHTLEILDKKLLKKPPFWRGVIDGDGHIRKTGRVVELTSASTLFLNQYIEFLTTCVGISAGVAKISKDRSCFRVIISGQNAVRLLEVIYAGTLNSDLCLPRKRDRAVLYGCKL
jgi:hypothetical protein